MKVIDLIIKLQDLDPNMQVLVDVTKDDSNMFRLVELAEAEEVGIEGNKGETEQVFLLMPGFPEKPQNMN